MKPGLVIEDQKPVRDAIGDLVTTLALQPKLIGDGAKALDELQRQAYDLITLDLNMPSLDGVSIVESLSTGEGPNAKTPIIVVSAYLTNDIESSLRQLGVNDFLGKPFDAGELVETVERLRNDRAEEEQE